MPTPIKPEDLRVGNLVLENGEMTIVSLADFYNMYKDDNCLFEPIPLTEEMLLKLGFETDLITAWLPNYKEVQIGVYACGYLPIFHGSISESFGEEIKYVHQLQNLYHALTGQELTLKE